MNNKGFTLIELLIIIGILALMGGLFSVNMTNILNRTNSNNSDEANTELKSATDAYLAINKELSAPLYSGAISGIEVRISDLKKSGLISKDYAINGRKIKDTSTISVRLGEQGELEFWINVSDN